ncbi:MAG: MtrB/PioB family decaheme-associated outer membrane protein [Burkholderiales bacterium]|nr:MtrB/PioB family decaheme-associated outer membrane protein [Burkholderiales bacterium]
MSKRMKQTFKVTALAAALFAVYGSAFAEGPENSVSIGIGNWSNDRQQAGIYDGMRDSGAYGLLDADITKRDEVTGTWLGLKARNLGLDNRELKGSWERQGDIGGSLEYSSITRDQPFVFNTGVRGIGTTLLTTTTITPGAGTNVELGTKRDRLTAKFFKNLGVGLNFNASFRNEEKDGTRLWSRGGASEFAVEPINSTIRLLEATLSYARDRLQLSGGYYGTSYSNGYSVVVSRRGATDYNLSLPQDNQSHELFLSGGYAFTPTTRGTFKASYSQATQNELLPMLTPGLIFPANNQPDARAPSKLDGRLDTTLLEVGLTAKPMPKLNVVANLRYRDFEDKTPLQQVVFNPPGNDNVWNTPFSYTNKVAKLEATYRLPQSYSLLGGIEYNGQDRTAPTVGTLYVPFRTSVNETTYRAQVRKSMSETVNGSLAYIHSKRDGSSYVSTGSVMEDSINPLNISDRKRDKVRAMVDWSPTDRLALQFSIEDAKDKYSGTVGPYGLQDGTARLYMADGSYRLSSDWQVNAWYSRDETRANEITQQNATVTKYNDLSETGDSFGLGVKGTVSSKLKVGGDLEHFRSVNQYKQNIVGGVLPASQAPVPDITNTMLRIKLFAQYAVQKNADLRLDLMHEKWSTNDWSWLYFPAAGGSLPWPHGNSDGTTVITKPQQDSTFIGVKYIYKFQ